jgi:hypothetical protein
MKKSLLIITLMLFSTLGFAQITKGGIQLGGSVGFSGGNGSSSFRLAPQAGLFVTDLTSVGLTMSYSSNSNFFGFGVFSRFHKKVVENFYFYLQPSISYLKGSSESGNSLGSELSILDIGIAPGVTYFLSPKFALGMNIGSLNYNSTTNESGGVKTNREEFTLFMNLNSASFNISYFIKK